MLSRRPDPAGEAGFTIIELLVSMTAGLAVLAAALVVVGQATTLTTSTQDRVDAAQRARRGVEDVVTSLRSAVCAPLASTTTIAKPLISADGNSINFYAVLGNQNALPAQKVLTYSPAARTLVETTYQGTGTASSVAIPATASSTRTLLENVVPGPAGSLFSYEKYTVDTAVDPPVVTGFAPIAGSVSATDLPLVVRVTVSARVRPLAATANSKRDTVLQVPTSLRYADALNPIQGVQC
jgi:Tfp pilus assembly protein PilW